ncbi:helix-turn-helix domain-containing protein [Paracoccus aminophilus]|uniref:Transcriptional regulator, AraC family n=1 Tax=Paracoccus aminophilus JCM 7686 TaxID=1367847 RepID=S5YAZ3_PARAH|nr:AraC family transcriptional regulator [Paracoccus aminophilus]AGT08578.1 transcriptional regulator, AraC family [Paracoccus aminophilus JCM 7686]
MTFQHSMICSTEGIRATEPVKWRGLDGLVGVYWEAEGQRGAQGYYLSPDPRIMLFFNEVSPHIRMANRSDELGRRCRGMTRAIYVPAGVPMWTRFSSAHRFSHLDLHIHKDRLLRFLAPSVGQSAALTALARPVEIEEISAIESLAGLLVQELATPSRHGVFAESLAGSIAAGLLDLPAEDQDRVSGGLTQAQLNKLTARLHGGMDRRLSVAEMAEIVGLSESWFSHAFKQTTGKTPQQWQLGERVQQAQKLLNETEQSVAGIAAQLGFSDQAHLTKAFRQVAGQTPGAWRRMRRIG